VYRFSSALAACLLLSVPALAAAAPMPPEVRGHIEDMKKECRQSGGSPAEPADSFLIIADLNGDGRTDWAIDEAGFNCDGATSTFKGSGGSQIYIFAGITGNRTRQAFMHGAYGMRLEGTAGHARLWLTVGGELCGQTGSFSRAEAISCERPLVWNTLTKQFEFAPLATVKLLKQVPAK
jgi:hypothetical protein